MFQALLRQEYDRKHSKAPPGESQNLFATLTVRIYVWIVPNWTLERSSGVSLLKKLQIHFWTKKSPAPTPRSSAYHHKVRSIDLGRMKNEQSNGLNYWMQGRGEHLCPHRALRHYELRRSLTAQKIWWFMNFPDKMRRNFNFLFKLSYSKKTLSFDLPPLLKALKLSTCISKLADAATRTKNSSSSAA